MDFEFLSANENTNQTCPKCRIAVCLTTYGLALNSDGLGRGSGIHLYFALQCLMDIPACIIVLVLADRTGRKRLMIASMLIGGLTCIGTIFTTLYGGKGITLRMYFHFYTCI